jgi:hypothetical protein
VQVLDNFREVPEDSGFHAINLPPSAGTEKLYQALRLG